MSTPHGAVNRSGDLPAQNAAVIPAFYVHPVDPAVVAFGVLHGFPEGTAILFIQPGVIGRDIYAGISVCFCLQIYILQQLAHAALSAVLREGVHEARPGRLLLRRDFISLGIGAERDQMISFCQEQQLAFLAQQRMETTLPQQLMQKLPGTPVTASDLAQPVLRTFAAEILDDFHIHHHINGITLCRIRFLYSLSESSHKSSLIVS